MTQGFTQFKQHTNNTDLFHGRISRAAGIPEERPQKSGKGEVTLKSLKACIRIVREDIHITNALKKFLHDQKRNQMGRILS